MGSKATRQGMDLPGLATRQWPDANSHMCRLWALHCQTLIAMIVGKRFVSWFMVLDDEKGCYKYSAVRSLDGKIHSSF